MAKKEFTVKLYKDCNDAWRGDAYFINDTLEKSHCVSASYIPSGKKSASVGPIKERLTEYETKMRERHPDWRRVEKDIYDNYPDNKR